MKKIKKIMALILCCVMAVGLFSGCEKNAGDEGVVTLKWHLFGVREGADNEMVMAEVNKKLEEKYNLRVDFVFTDMGSYNQKMNSINASGEEYDLAYMSVARNNLQQNISNGCIIDLSELLPKYAPETYKSMGEETWDCVKSDGKIYAVPNWQVHAKSAGLYVDKQILDDLGMSVDDIKTMDDLGNYIKKAQGLDRQVDYLSSSWEFLSYEYGIQPLHIGKVAGVRYKENGKPQIINIYDTDEYKEYINLRNKWVDDGILTDLYSPTTKYSDKSVRRSLGSWAVYTPGADVTQSINMGYDIALTQFSDAVFASDTVNAALTGVSATSKHPEEAVKLIEILNTDKEIYNMLLYGIEGIHYDKIGENTIRVKEGSAYDKIPYYQIGSQKNAYVVEGQSEKLAEETDAYNKSAYISPTNGVNFSTSNIEAEISNCTTVVNEQAIVIDLGVAEDGALEKFLKDLEAAGVDRLIADLQRQVDEAWSKK